MLLALGEAVWNRSGQGLLRALAQDFPKAVFLLTTLLFITTLGLGFADAVSAWLMGMFSGSANDFADHDVQRHRRAAVRRRHRSSSSSWRS